MTAWSLVLLLAAPCLGAVGRASAASPKPAGPAVVQVGGYLNDVQNLDLKSHSYGIDLYLWFRWRDKDLDPAASFEFMNPFELWGHVRTGAYPKPLRLPDGTYYQVVRDQGRFCHKLRLFDYPFDEQDLTVELEDADLTVGGLVFEEDPRGFKMNPSLELPGFVIGRPELKVVESAYVTDFGDPRPKGKTAHSRAVIRIPIARPVFPYGVKFLLPILCVIFCASLMFMFHPKHVDSRVGIGITALLTIVALQITLNDGLPEIGYLVLMDKVYLSAYIYVIAGLAVVVKTTWLLEEGQCDRAIRLDRRSLVLLTLAYMVALLLLLSRVL
ncbi:MAG: hypothetical protein HY927_03570 [Elusimicrobia bacterium]|nr:hypothetical protein [Elusimicrobiota bacterium]